MKDLVILINNDDPRNHTVNFENGYAGLNGENLQGNIIFKFKNFIEGQARAEIVIDNQDGYILLDRVNDTYVLPIKASLLTGHDILMQLVIDEPTNTRAASVDYPIWKSETFLLDVGCSINADQPIPEEYPSWVEVINGLINDVEEEIEKVDNKIQEIDDAIEETNNLNIEVSKEDDVTTIKLTKKDGQVEETEVLDGEQGERGETGLTPNIQIGNVTTGSPSSVTRRGTNENPILDFVLEQGEQGQKGDTGNGIQSVVKTSTSGLIDTYTITYTNGTTTTFNVANGNGISNIQKTSTSGLVDTYTITYTDGTTQTYQVTNGEDGEVTQSQLDEVIAENDYLNSIINQIVPKVSGSGEYITLNDTIEAKMDIDLYAKLLSQITTTGKNLLDSVKIVQTQNGVTFTPQPDGGIKITGTSTAGINIQLVNTSNPPILEAGTYMRSVKCVGNITKNGSYVFLTGRNSSSTSVMGDININSNTTMSKESTLTQTETMTGIGVYANGTGVVFDCIIYIQIEKGSTATDWERYTGGIPAPNPQYPQDIHTISGSNTLKVEGRNILNWNNCTQQKAWNESGQLVTNSACWACNDKQPIKSSAITLSVDFTTSSGTQGRVYQFNSSGTLIVNTAVTTFPTTITFNQNTAYYVYYFVNNLVPYNSKLQLEYGETASPFEPYTLQEANIDLGDIEYCKIGDYEDKFMKGDGTNIFDDVWEEGGYNSSTGAKTTDSSLRRNVNPIYVQPNETYIVSNNGTGVAMNILEYKANNTFIQARTISSGVSFTTNSETAYINIFRGNTNIELVKVEKGSTITPFTPYGTGWYLKKNIGKVDLGTLSYSKVTNATYGDYFKTSDITNAVKQQTYYSTSFNALCNSYRVAGRNVSEFLDNTFVFDGTSTAVTEIQFKNSNYSDATTFKNSLSGVYLYYPILTQYLPITGTLSNQLDNIKSKLLSQKGQTNISQVNNDLPFEISVSALGELNV